MSLVATIRALVNAGATPEMLLAVVETHEAARDDALARRRASDAARQQAQRDKGHVKSRDVTLPVNGHADSSPHAGAYAQVVNPSLPSLRSEEVKPPSTDVDVHPLKAKLAKPNGFARFWEAYPNKVGKKAAEAEYARAVKAVGGPDPASVIMAGLERAKACRKWADGYIPNPKTWLHQGRWDDEPAEVVPLRATGPPSLTDRIAAEKAEARRLVLGNG